jgi:RimJ/RimL family protein N-acetyltransferase
VIHRILDSSSEGGLGLRRCQWFANSLNEPSKAAARRLGFKQDGLLRNHRVLGVGKDGANRTSPL